MPSTVRRLALPALALSTAALGRVRAPRRPAAREAPRPPLVACRRWKRPRAAVGTPGIPAQTAGSPGVESAPG